jgi:hypothetical protein
MGGSNTTFKNILNDELRNCALYQVSIGKEMNPQRDGQGM